MQQKQLEKQKQRQESIDSCSIRYACTGKRISAGGFLWRYNEENKVKYKRKRHPNARPILQFDRNMVLIKEWESVLEASKKLGYHPSNISRSAKCKNPRGKFIWRYKL